MTRPRTTLVALAASAAVVAVAVATLAACGVPLDSSPRPISRATTTAPQTPPTTAARPGAEEVGVYFLDEDRLVRQAYPVEGEPTLRQAIGFVLDNPAEGSPSNLRTAIPPGTTLRNLSVAAGVATIDLTSEINDVSGPTQKQAFAQVVFTALDFSAVKEVRFRIDGKPVDAPTDDGNLALVDAGNYDPPLNPR
jgi:spore germination protein GerM